MGVGTEFIGPVRMHRGRDLRSKYEEANSNLPPPGVGANESLTSNIVIPNLFTRPSNVGGLEGVSRPLEGIFTSKFNNANRDTTMPREQSFTPISARVYGLGRAVGGDISSDRWEQMGREERAQHLESRLFQNTYKKEPTLENQRQYADKKPDNKQRTKAARIAKIKENQRANKVKGSPPVDGPLPVDGPTLLNRNKGSVTLVERPISVPRDEYRDPPAIELPRGRNTPDEASKISINAKPKAKVELSSKSMDYNNVRQAPPQPIKNTQGLDNDSLLDKNVNSFEDEIEDITKDGEEEIIKNKENLDQELVLTKIKLDYESQLAEQQHEIAILHSKIGNLENMIEGGLRSASEDNEAADKAYIQHKEAKRIAKEQHKIEKAKQKEREKENFFGRIKGEINQSNTELETRIKQRLEEKISKEANERVSHNLIIYDSLKSKDESIEAMRAEYAADKKAAAEREQAEKAAKKQRQAEKAKQIQTALAAKKQRQAEKAKQMQAALAEIQSQVAESKQGLLQSVGDLQKKVESNRDWLSNLSANRRNNTESIEAMRAEYAADKKAAAEREQAEKAAKKQRQAEKAAKKQRQAEKAKQIQTALAAKKQRQAEKAKQMQAALAEIQSQVAESKQGLLQSVGDLQERVKSQGSWLSSLSANRQNNTESIEAMRAEYAADKKAAAEREQAEKAAKKQRQAEKAAKKQRQAEKAKQIQTALAAKKQRQAEKAKQMQAALAEIQSQVAESKQGLLQSVGDLQERVKSQGSWLSSLSANRQNNTESIEAMRAEYAADKKAAAEREQAAIAAKKQRQAEKARQVQAEKAAQSKAITNLQTQLDAVKRTRNEDVKVFNKNHEEHWADRGVLTTRIQALEEEIERKNIEMQKYASELEEYKARLVSMEQAKPSVDMGAIRSQLASLEGRIEGRFGNVRRAIDQVNSHLSDVETFYAPPGSPTHPFDPRKDQVGRHSRRLDLIHKI